MKTSLIQPRMSNHLIFYKSFGGNFCEQPLVLGKLLNFATSNVLFGSVSINPVTYLVEYCSTYSKESNALLLMEQHQNGSMQVKLGGSHHQTQRHSYFYYRHLHTAQFFFQFCMQHFLTSYIILEGF